MSGQKNRGTTDASSTSGHGDDKRRWQAELESQPHVLEPRLNRSGIAAKPLYGPDDWDPSRYDVDLGLPGQWPFTRGIHASMHRGRPWSPRLVVGLGVPGDYNRRMRDLYAMGLTGLYVSPCNSHMRGFDGDEVDRELLGNCGTLIASSDDMAACLDGLPIDRESVSLGDTAPYTLSALLLKVAKDRGIPWSALAGTTNQSDYLSHYAALHMFFRIALPGQRRVLLDHIEWMNRHAPKWNPISVVGQHIQQAGATPAEAMGLALSSAIQYANDLGGRGLSPDSFLPRFSFFFDVSISLFEEIAKFRAARRLWARLTRDRFGAVDPRSHRFRFHAQTSGADLTRQQPLNNIARVTVQAMAGIFGGLQSLHTDSYDEAYSAPTDRSAQIAVATQNILREEAHLDDVIDPLGGSYYVEALTNEMEARIESVIRSIDEQGGMYAAVQSGFVQRMIGRSSLEFQERVERGEQTVVGVNKYVQKERAEDRAAPLERPDPAKIDAYLASLKGFRASRDRRRVDRALDDLAHAFESTDQNTYEKVVQAVEAGATHGEICSRVREAVGFGEPLVVV
jgi:methylmalonyl-CoA mutase N-terminal domain/subunit